MFFLNRNQAVDILKEVLESIDSLCPDIFSLDRTKNSADFRVRIKIRDRDKPEIKQLALHRGLAVNEETDLLVIY